MWLPYTDAVVVVVSNPFEEGVSTLPPCVPVSTNVHLKHLDVPNCSHQHHTHLVLSHSRTHTHDPSNRTRDFDKPPVPEQQKLAHVRKLLLAHPLNKVSHV